MSKVANSNDNKIRILFCGNINVGKSCIIQRLITNNFIENYTPTVGVDFRSIYYQINQTKVQVNLLDIPGQDRYNALTLSQIRNVDGVVFVYDISDMDSFTDIINWQQKIQSAAHENTFQTLLGNKCDLLDRQVPFNKGLEFAESKSMNFFETSAKNGKDVVNSVQSLAQKIFCERLMNQNQQKNDENGTVKLQKSKLTFLNFFKGAYNYYC
ncbi:small GTPase family Rab protein (macronuclear) [Tetrahymena thermophila SB210]|uniref:Small GTPase family Rab protein n=2 Tax=Tetrahymena thermophila TaxID=5911 RepID=Q22R58_TETTS|nr:small GTPase family Rab protein [Tetrahymena thermophila SB210]EAR88264.1 small GTPase family Rab protein [Tetrahymena thermophila SB210]BAJ21326.1 Rab-family small GTPase RabX19 [Tetrahymena thermophila]|eukprot:XP_001008509.1 small GTPase family Rab protein [Tetrahymena thermophila SB210]